MIYTTIESLTLDGRDRSLDYKITGFHVAKGAWDGRVIDQIAPQGDEIVLAKTSSSVFISTNIDYVLRNLGVKQLVISGLITDQCLESAIRDACDLGYLVTQVSDACLTYCAQRHDQSLRTVQGYCRQVTARQLVAEIETIRPRGQDHQQQRTTCCLFSGHQFHAIASPHHTGNSQSKNPHHPRRHRRGDRLNSGVL